jgi:hypothetical protein
LPTVGEAARGLRDRPLGRALILVLVIAAAVLVARSCGKTDPRVSEDQAIAIAKQEVDFEPNDVRVRFQKRGFSQREFWLVGLGIKGEDGRYQRATNVLVDANTGEVAGVQPVDVEPG